MNIEIYGKAYVNPYITVLLNNDILFDGYCEQEDWKLIQYVESLESENTLIIKHSKKTNEDTVVVDDNIISDKAFELYKVVLDGINIPTVTLFSQKFYPNWPKNIIIEHEGYPPEYITNNLYFGFNGTYELNFNKDIQQWYFKQLIEKEKTANDNNQKLITLSDGSEIETFEFANKTMQADFDGVLSISELYERVQLEDK